ncbi:LytR C-terminal domain-containing protein [Nocardioides sp. TF02-7]|uniref:LytR C-terminal domain-containing protein n=1 Tax=Nocardioides sp. TF02-7 TaxID=2917724 RepID=UPI001F059B75|nr:LytR C-terminal domain-containing protein [Nocardioides sp. TF02-7]UMG93471.1 LytR C-terminal domain-containing protein [Nocardioides sp. TF02-7]
MSFPTWPPHPRRDERGAVLPSPVVLLSVVAVALAAVTFFATRGEEPTEREITQAAQQQESPEVTAPSDGAEDEEKPEKPKKTKPPVVRSDVGVVVFNNSGITGLAADVLARVDEVGWNGVAADNWYGTIPATTVYFPPGMRDAAQKLALDLGIQRLMPADGEMSDTDLTVILTGELA